MVVEQAPTTSSATCTALLKSTGLPCAGPVIKEGRCMRHTPSFLAARPAAQVKINATRRATLAKRAEEERQLALPRRPGRPLGSKNSPEVIAKMRGRKQSPEQVANRKAKMAEPERKARHAKNVSRAQLRQKVQDGGVPRWQRIVAQHLLDRDMDTGDMGQLMGVKMITLYGRFNRTNVAPSQVTVDRLETIFGPFPGDVKLEIRQHRSDRAGGKKSQERLKETIRRLKRPQLEQKLKGMRGTTDAQGRLLPEFRDALPDFYDRGVGVSGYNLYKKAQAKQARSALPAGWQKSRLPGPATYVKTPKGVLRMKLSGLRRRKINRFYQCQACTTWWVKDEPSRRGELCASCWNEYERIRGAWRITGRNGVEPSLPQRSGGKQLSPDEIQERIISLLQFHVPGEPGPDTTSSAYRRLSRTMQTVEASTHPWFQGVTELLAQLHNLSHTRS